MASYASIDPCYARTSDFLKWLEERGVTISHKIEVADLRANSAGRGIGNEASSESFASVFAEAPAVAVDNIEEDEELFTIAQSDILTVQNSTLQQVKPHLLERLDSWNSLVLVMIYEDGLGEQSTWWDYLQMLPTKFDVRSKCALKEALLTGSAIQTLIYWSSTELAELEGCAVLNKIRKDDADDSFKMSLLPVVQQQPDLFGRHAQDFGGSDASTVLLNLAHRMATLIMAYGFDIQQEPFSSEEEDEGEEADGSSQLAYELNKGMVPLADLFNAEGDLNNAHLIQHGDGFMKMVALQPIAKGQQLFNDYGQLPRSDLLLELAAKWEVLQDGYDLSRPPQGESFEFDQSLLLTTTALLLDTDAVKQATASIATPNQPPLFLLTTLSFVLKGIISQRQRAYGTTLAEDLALLEDPTVQGRRRMAIEVRLGEKEILAMAALRVEETIADIGRRGPKTSYIEGRL